MSKYPPVKGSYDPDWSELPLAAKVFLGIVFLAFAIQFAWWVTS